MVKNGITIGIVWELFQARQADCLQRSRTWLEEIVFVIPMVFVVWLLDWGSNHKVMVHMVIWTLAGAGVGMVVLVLLSGTDQSNIYRNGRHNIARLGIALGALAGALFARATAHY